MNLRKSLYFALFRLKGLDFEKEYHQYLKEDQQGISPDTIPKALTHLLTHCKKSNPYYSKFLSGYSDSALSEPEKILPGLPILTRQHLRHHFQELNSNDLPNRRWFVNHTGGSTGEPVEFIQDKFFSIHSGAIQLFFMKQLGREIGEKCVLLWGSERDFYSQSEGLKARLVNGLAQTIYVNVYRMNPGRMREFVRVINEENPRLVIGYIWSLYELAKFVEQEGLKITPQSAVISTAGTLYPLIREKIERVFGCKVYNRYGSREMGDMACERPGMSGLWVAPWSTYIEIVDDEGNRVPDGVEGRILVTSLINYAMPLVRYEIGDIGKLSPQHKGLSASTQVLEAVLGRNSDMFINKENNVIDSTYFLDVFYAKGWLKQYQVIQKARSALLLRFVVDSNTPRHEEFDEIVKLSKAIMDDPDCEVNIEFVDHIPSTPSGKFRFIMSEVER